jgi:multidrug efflux pump
MSRLILWTLHNRKITLFIVLTLIVFGIASYYFLPRQENPDLVPSIAMVITVYPGAIPGDIEKLVTMKIEDAVSDISGFESVESFSRNSSSIVVVKIDPNVDREKAWIDMRQKVEDIIPDLPEGCWKPQVLTNLGETAGMVIALSGSNYTYDQLEAFAERFKENLMDVKGVRKFEIAGKIEREVVVEVEAGKLNSYSVSLEDIYKILLAQNIEIPAGRLTYPSGRIGVNVPGIYDSLKDIENTIVDVSQEDGSVARIKDFAKVEMRLKEDAVKIRQNGENAILLTGYFQDDRNIVIIGSTVRKIIDEVKAGLPEDLTVTEVLYQPEDVKDAVRGFMSNLLWGMLFVIFVVFLGMGWRNALVVATAIPLSILISYTVMYLTGIQLHQISTTALIISLGMLVDNAIVISDAIQYRIDRKMEPLKAALEGVKESALPVLTATLTTVAAFCPLLFLPGMVGQYVIAIPQLIIVSLTASYLVAMLVTPVLASIIFVPDSSNDRKKESPVRKIFSFLLDVGLTHPLKTMLTAFLLFAVVIGTAFIVLQLRFFPNADKNIVYADIYSETFDIEKTDVFTLEIEKIISKQPEVISYTASVGDDLPKFYITMMPRAPSVRYSMIMMRTDLGKGGRFSCNEDFAHYLQHLINSSVAGGNVRIKVPQQAEPLDAPVLFRVSGEDQDKINYVSQILQEQLSKIEGTIDVRDNFPKKTFEFTVDIDTDLSSSLGILKYDVQRQVNIALKGASPTVFRKAGKEFDITLKSNIKTREDLENLAIKSSVGGNKVLLKEFTDIQLESREEQINRFNRKRSVSVLSDVIPGYGAPHISIKMARDVIRKTALKGTVVKDDGELHGIIKNFGYLGIASIIALFIIYLILVIEFGSLSQPVIILITVPLSLIGAAIGLMIFSQPFSFTAFLGISSLIGIVVNNAILLIEFLNKFKKEEKDVSTACRTAFSRRFRPIMMSTTTTVMGLLPLAMSGSTLFEPLSISLMSGLLGSTLLTLIIVPVIYKIMENLKSKVVT